jgi:hypothetical protein
LMVISIIRLIVSLATVASSSTSRGIISSSIAVASVSMVQRAIALLTLLLQRVALGLEVRLSLRSTHVGEDRGASFDLAVLSG